MLVWCCRSSPTLSRDQCRLYRMYSRMPHPKASSLAQAIVTKKMRELGYVQGRKGDLEVAHQ